MILKGLFAVSRVESCDFFISEAAEAAEALLCGLGIDGSVQVKEQISY